jgi:thiol:disulfide interchange protein
MSIVPRQRPVSKQYATSMAVGYFALASYLVYRGYQQHDQRMYIFAAVLVLAVVVRLIRIQRLATVQTVQQEQTDQPVDLFTKPKDF